jgi:thioesterase domain-containing protein
VEISTRRAASVRGILHRRGSKLATPSQRQYKSLDPARAEVYAAELVALRRYQPRYYPGKVTFLKAATSSRFPKDPVKVWKPLVAEIEIETAPGDHTEMIAKHAQGVAHFVTRHVGIELSQSGQKK